MPKLWKENIEAHRRAVSGKILDVAARLAMERGLSSVTMSSVAETAGIGRATLYKYFADVEMMLLAWHQRQVTHHLAALAKVRDQAPDARSSLEAVLEAYALMSHATRGTELAALLHRKDHAKRPEQLLSEFLRDILTDGAKSRLFRDDVAPDELARYCLHAAQAAARLTSKAAVRRLVMVILDGLSPTA